MQVVSANDGGNVFRIGTKRNTDKTGIHLDQLIHDAVTQAYLCDHVTIGGRVRDIVQAHIQAMMLSPNPDVAQVWTAIGGAAQLPNLNCP